MAPGAMPIPGVTVPITATAHIGADHRRGPDHGTDNRTVAGAGVIKAPVMPITDARTRRPDSDTDMHLGLCRRHGYKSRRGQGGAQSHFCQLFHDHSPSEFRTP